MSHDSLQGAVFGPIDNIEQPHTSTTNVRGDEEHPVVLNEYSALINAEDELERNEASSLLQQDISQRLSAAQTVQCRVCEHQIPYLNKTMQHVIRCPACSEATPIRTAPTGKKFVRCPCNCLLICKVSSNRIACPRPNCSRVIILKPTSSNESAISPPAGTTRVQCCYCEEISMLNILSSYITPCPHCQKRSSISRRFVRMRAIGYFLATVAAFLIGMFISIGGEHEFGFWLIFIDAALLALVLFFGRRFYMYATMRISRILGPV